MDLTKPLGWRTRSISAENPSLISNSSSPGAHGVRAVSICAITSGTTPSTWMPGRPREARSASIAGAPIVLMLPSP